jgi:hypothetical protein
VADCAALAVLGIISKLKHVPMLLCVPGHLSAGRWRRFELGFQACVTLRPRTRPFSMRQ